MKKILVSVLVLVMCLTAFVACNPTDDNTPDTPDLTGLNAAKEYLQTMLNSESTVTGADFTRPATLRNQHGDYTVTWTLDVTSGPAESIVLGDVVDALQKFNVDEFSSEEVIYTLTATITDANGNTATLTYNHKVPAFALNSYEEYLAGCEANDGETIYTIKGYVVGVNADSGSSSKGSLWIVDADGNGYYAYAPTLDASVTESREAINAAFPLGTEVVVKGTVTTYSGCLEFNKGCEVIYTGNSVDPSTLPYVDCTELFGSASSMTDAEKLIGTQSTRVALNGVTMGEIDGYNYHFTVNGVDFICYMNIYLLSEEENAELVAKWNPGGKANLTGIINVYSSKYQIYPDTVNSVEIVTETLTDAEKVARQKDLLTLEETYNDNFTLPAGTWANVTWAITGDGATLGDNGAVTINQTSVEQTVTITATISSGEATDTKEFTVKIAAARTSFIKAAINAAGEDGTTTEDSYIIVGTVSELDGTYSEQYGNVSFYVADAEGNNLLVYRYNLDDAATIAVGDAVAFAAPIKNYKGTIEAVSTFTALDIMTLADAAEAGLAGTGVDGTVVYGYVKSIDSAYSSQYNNITITISDGTNDFYCYRVAGGEDIVVGEYLLITGTPSAYKGAAQMAAGATYSRSNVYVAPETPAPAEKVTTIADALTAAVGTEAELEGTVVGLGTWNTQYSNWDVTISDGTNLLLVYRCTNSELGIGDVVSVVGTIGAYNNVNQIAQGSTVTVVTAHVCTFDPADCDTPATCPVCEKTDGEALGHVDENPADGTCDRCQANLQQASSQVTASKTIAELITSEGWDGNTTSQTFNLDEKVTVAINGGSNTGKAYNGDHIRIYATDSPAGTITISVPDGYELVSVKITTQVGTYAFLYLGEGTTDICNVETAVSGQSVVLNSVKNGDNGKQVRVTAIEVVYRPVA